MRNIYAQTPVVMVEPQETYDLIAYIYTPPELRGQGLMRKLWKDTILPDVTRNLFLVFSPDEGTDPLRLQQFYESIGFEFHSDGTYAVRVFKD